MLSVEKIRENARLLAVLDDGASSVWSARTAPYQAFCGCGVESGASTPMTAVSGPGSSTSWAGVLDLAGLSARQRVLDADCGKSACLRALAADLIGFSDVS